MQQNSVWRQCSSAVIPTTKSLQHQVSVMTPKISIQLPPSLLVSEPPLVFLPFHTMAVQEAGGVKTTSHTHGGIQRLVLSFQTLFILLILSTVKHSLSFIKYIIHIHRTCRLRVHHSNSSITSIIHSKLSNSRTTQVSSKRAQYLYIVTSKQPNQWLLYHLPSTQTSLPQGN